jgi:hypothetical protein
MRRVLDTAYGTMDVLYAITCTQVNPRLSYKKELIIGWCCGY